MTATDTHFAGSIPALYDRYLGPLLFEPYAQEVARRAADRDPRRILETAAGTGIVTEAVHRAVLEAEIIATDLSAGFTDFFANEDIDLSEFGRGQPVRAASPDEIAATFAFVTSADAGYMSGAIVVLDGGATA